MDYIDLYIIEVTGESYKYSNKKIKSKNDELGKVKIKEE